jgi:hypothetical protein
MSALRQRRARYDYSKADSHELPEPRANYNVEPAIPEERPGGAGLLVDRAQTGRLATAGPLRASPMYTDISPYVRCMRGDAPNCAQCRQPMILRRVERKAFRPRIDVFLCCGCGLIDKVEWRGEQRRPRVRPGSHLLWPIRKAYV